AAGTLRGRLQQLRSLWSVRTIIDRPTMLGTEPLGTEESTEVFGAGARPKRNMRRPHQDVGRCLGMVAWMFDNIADDVLAHLRWWSESTASADDAPASRDACQPDTVGLVDEVASTLVVRPAARNNASNPTCANTALSSRLGMHDANEAVL